MQVTSIQSGDLKHARKTARQAAKLLAKGQLVVFPTETVYGIAASAKSEKGVEALRRFKQRQGTQPFTIHLPDATAANGYIDVTSPTLARLIRKVFPGPVTLVVDVSDDTIADRTKAMGLSADVADRLYHNNTVGLRCPDHPLTQQMLSAIDEPIIASSANKRGQTPPHDVEQAAQAVQDEAGLIVDGGPCRYDKPSTIVRVRGDGPSCSITVERKGVYDERIVRKLLRWTVLFVCSGNTCRSPMAQILAQSIMAKRRGFAIEDLETAGVRVISAGVYATSGMTPSQEAVGAMGKIGLDLSRYRSKPIAIELINEADVIYCMTESHRDTIVDMMPSAADKIMRLDPNGDVDDPIGSDATAYQRCAEVLRRRIDQRLTEHQL